MHINSNGKTNWEKEYFKGISLKDAMTEVVTGPFSIFEPVKKEYIYDDGTIKIVHTLGGIIKEYIKYEPTLSVYINNKRINIHDKYNHENCLKLYQLYCNYLEAMKQMEKDFKKRL